MSVSTGAADLLQQLRAIVGNPHVLTDDRSTRRYRKGHRTGEGKVLAVVRPGTLLEQWRSLQAAVAADCIVIMQAANTGLTGGSTPDGDDYDRDIVLMNTMRLQGIQVINDGEQVVCLPGATLDRLEQTLAPLEREPHSVIGSSCIGASVLGGVCNNSGGALVRRGPAYTELTLYAQVLDDGTLQLVNHLGIHLGDTPEEILSRLEQGKYSVADIINDPERKASDPRYAEAVRDVDAQTPARFNADPSRLYEASGSAGKLCIFAVRLDTFPKEASTVFYIGTNDPDELTAVRRHLLTDLPRLPIAGEYIHRTAYDIGEQYGKDTFLLIDRFGTAKVPSAFAMKSRIDGFFERFGWRGVTDRVIQAIMNRLPSHLPPRMREWRDRFEHHLLLRVSNDTAQATREFLSQQFEGSQQGAYFECDAEEGRKAFLHRFAIAGAAIRYRESHPDSVEDIVALDIALRRNDKEWVEQLPDDMEKDIVHKLYYGHFLCHVFHQDYIVKKGVVPLDMEHRMWKLLDERRAEYPAEHNVGHLYIAKPALAGFYRELDPTNTFNPGIGHTSRRKWWTVCCGGKHD
ncbi:D-lactate dehydrogenase [Alcaligenes aquatilis]|jgi:D-lactate dehydrogenase|uniref:Quinone-dependent D-lactate dehydrogenase n=2 Tax=Alcaligenes TaxID=507 RepID=A0AB33CP29_ALCFA|nr:MULTISPECIES: D-lactate dehydrogenase [Alcaligenes]ASR88366.1 D-lactate dehydrogenase [Alcaligenes faecalis]AWG35909.1 D-lactate dehydrogenase [Alcaligenes aquatilis]MCC9163536.1 D-lactate dehydrogenase [Alcaligenes sp. MMA]MCH4224945.1 D-lactate dehydrogenase [Alcaligenes faecalis]UQN36461.1 D-lactate dehydrogenase [Alcaligenes aquatilis]